VTVMEKWFAACGKGNTISGRILRLQTLPVFEEHQLPATGNR
jgi:hypothetical protein